MQVKCEKCGDTTDDSKLFKEHSADEHGAPVILNICEACFGEAEKNHSRYANPLDAAAKHVLLTTGPQFGNGQKFHEVDVVTAECVLGMNVFRDVLAGLRDVVGGRSATTQNALRDLRKTCLSELKLEAHALGADGVISVDLDYSEFSGGGKSMLFLVASGTAVKFTPPILSAQ
jgi:uncharacterized protein YbjQ (UPF0145 family)